MRTISLDGQWGLVHFGEGQHHPHSPAELKSLGLAEIQASVPGNVELDLVRAGQLPDPFFGENMRRLRELETHQWWYRRSFDLPADARGAELDAGL